METYRPFSSTRVSIKVQSEQLAVWTLNNEFVVEPGQFGVKVGTSNTTFLSAVLTVH